MSGRPEKFPRRQDTEYEVDELPEDETEKDIPLQELDPNTSSTSSERLLSPSVLMSSIPQIDIPTDISDCSTLPTDKDGEYDVSTDVTDLGSTEKSEGTNMQPYLVEPANDTIAEPSSAEPCNCAACLSCTCSKKCKKLLDKEKEPAEKDNQKDDQKDKEPGDEKI